MVVATRPLAGRDRYRSGQLLPSLGVQSDTSVNLVDLDVPPYSDPAALSRYAAVLLAQDGVDFPGPLDAAWLRYREDTTCGAGANVVASRADKTSLSAH